MSDEKGRATYGSLDELIRWLNEAVAHLHRDRLIGGYQNAFSLEYLMDRNGFTYMEEDRTLLVWIHNGTLKIVLLMFRTRQDRVEAVLRLENGLLVGVAQLKQSRTNSREMWCDLRTTGIGSFTGLRLSFQKTD